MWNEKGPSQAGGLKSLIKDVPMPQEPKNITYHAFLRKEATKMWCFFFFCFSLFEVQRTWKYSMLEIHDAEWEEGKVGTAGCFGAIFISKIVPQENQKRTLYPCLTCFTGRSWRGCYALSQLHRLSYQSSYGPTETKVSRSRISIVTPCSLIVSFF